MKRKRIANQDTDEGPHGKIVALTKDAEPAVDTDDSEDSNGDDDEEKAVTVSSKTTAAESKKVEGRRLSKSELYKPPTSEELNELKETETLFQSSLFRMQIGELLAEVTMKERHRAMADDFVGRLKAVLMALPTGDQCKMTEQYWLKPTEVPIIQEPFEVRGHFCFVAPRAVHDIGSYAVHTATKPDLHIDLALEIPNDCLQAKDYLNQCYLRKRAIYLAAVAMHLSHYELVGEMKYTYHHDDHMKPLLWLKPSGDLSKRFAVRLHTCPEASRFKLSRYVVTQSNVRRQWWNQAKDEQQQDGDEPATPLYNTSILRDMTFAQTTQSIRSALCDASGIRDGVVLLKVWLHQRHLDVRRGCFSGFVMTMLVKYLLCKRTISRQMSSYQVLRNTLAYLAKVDWRTHPISLAPSGGQDANRPTMEQFRAAFELVFVDPTGYVNIAAGISSTMLMQVRHEASLSLRFLETPGLDSFQPLFMRPLSFVQQFDCSFTITDFSWLRDAVAKYDLHASLCDHCGDMTATCLPKLVEILRRAVGQRLHLLALKPNSVEKWDVTDKAPSPNARGSLSFGMILNTEFSSSVLDKGPPADSPESAEFREFWGDVSEMRRFQDGSICEAVVWPADSIAKKRFVVRQIVQHILKRYFQISETSLRFHGDQLDQMSQPQQTKAAKTTSTGEEHQMAALRCYDALCTELRALRDLPLAITSLVGTSPVFRAAETFPPMPANFTSSAVPKAGRLVPLPGRKCPPWAPTMDVLCLLEGSGSWPEDLEAIRRVKAAFHVKLAEALRRFPSLITRVTPTYIDIAKMGYVFRVRVGHKRDISLLKMLRTPDGMLKMIDTEQSLEMERQLVLLPKLSTALYSIHQKYTSYSGAVRLAKRWLSSQLLLQNYFLEEAIELVVAHLYLSPAPYVVPSSPLTGFLRFLHLMSTHDWQNTPLLINFNDELKPTEFAALESRFRTERSTMPLMFLATPYDNLSSVWTKQKPSAPILQRAALLASKSRDILEAQLVSETTTTAALTDFRAIFRPPLSMYDLIIELECRQLARNYDGVDPLPGEFAPVRNESETQVSRVMPVVNYDPVQYYLRELRESYDDMALFFHDQYGGSIIAVLWKPKAFQPRPFKAAEVKGHMLSTEGNRKQLVPNVEAFIDDIRTMGQGLVSKVKVMSEKWKICKEDAA